MTSASRRRERERELHPRATERAKEGPRRKGMIKRQGDRVIPGRDRVREKIWRDRARVGDMKIKFAAALLPRSAVDVVHVFA